MGLICALGSYFLDYCFWPNSIFKNYLPWLSRKVVKHYNITEFELISKLPKESQEQQFIDTASNYFIYKPLGGCAVCMNVYLAFISYFVIYALTWFLIGEPLLEWYYFIPYVLTSSAFLRKLVKATY